MDAEVYTLFKSDYYKIIDFKCRCTNKSTSGVEYSSRFNISFIRKGNFAFNAFRRSFDAFNGYALVNKPGCEHTVGHCHHIPDECTLIYFSDSYYNKLIELDGFKSIKFFKNEDIQSAMVKTSSGVDYLHYLIYSHCKSGNPSKLVIDSYVFEVLHWVLSQLNGKECIIDVNPRLKKIHLNTIEQAKDYIINNYMNDISLSDISSYCAVSPFHFSRLFKSITDSSPYKFLLDVRLKNSELLIKNSKLQIFDIAIQSGFNGVENFNDIFKQRFGMSPIEFRNK